MNRWIFSASIVSGLTLLIHTFAGESLFHAPALQSNLSIENKMVLSVVWHGITSVMVLSFVALILAVRSAQDKKSLLLFIAAQYAAMAGLFIGFGLFRLGSLFIMPQWTILLALAALIFAGTRAARPSIGDQK